MRKKLTNEWTTRNDGLVSNQIHSLIYANHQLWLASPQGLINYNGSRTTTYTQASGLLSHGLRRLVKHQEFLYVCSDRGIDQFAIADKAVTKSISTADLGLGWCQAAAPINQDTLLIACANGLRLWNLKANQINSLDCILDNEFIVNLIGYGKDKALIQASSSGLWLYSDGNFEKFGQNKVSDSVGGQHLSIQPNGISVIGKKHIFELDNEFNFKRRITLPDDLTDIKQVLRTSDNEYYLATQDSLIRTTRSDFEHTQVSLIESNININEMVNDDYGNLWVATDSQGLLKYSGLNDYITSYYSNKHNSILAIRKAKGLRLNQNIADNPIANIRQSSDAQDSLLIAGSTASYITQIDAINESVEIISLRNNPCWDLQYEANAGIWAATEKGLYYINQADLEDNILYKEKEIGHGRCIQFLPHQQILYGCVSGLFLFDLKTKQYSSLVEKKQNSLGYIYSIVKKSNDLYYICTLGNGLWLYNNNDKRLNKVNIGEKVENVYSVDFGSNEEIFIVADNLLIQIKQKLVSILYRSDDAVFAWQCVWINSGHILLATSAGLKFFGLNSHSLDFIIDRFPNNIIWEFTTSRSLLITKGTAYCGLNEGFKEIEFEALKARVKEPVPEIKSINCDSKILIDSQQLYIDKGEWTLTLDLGCNWLWMEKTLSFSYRLVGLQNDWQSLDGPSIKFTTLPVGNFLLEVKVNNALALIQKPTVILAIQVNGITFIQKTMGYFPKFINYLVVNFVMFSNLFRLSSRYQEMENEVIQRATQLDEANKNLKKLASEISALSKAEQIGNSQNLRYFYDYVERRIEDSNSLQTSIAIILVSVDNIHSYKQSYGYLASNQCVSLIQNCLENITSKNGCSSAQIDQTESIIFVESTSRSQVFKLASRCVTAINRLNIVHEFDTHSEFVTISMGLSIQAVNKIPLTSEASELRQTMINQADDALYMAKNAGGNRYFEYTDNIEYIDKTGFVEKNEYMAKIE